MIREFSISVWFVIWIFHPFIRKLILLRAFRATLTFNLFLWVEWVFYSPIHLFLRLGSSKRFINGLCLNGLGLIDMLFFWEFEMVFDFCYSLLDFLNAELFVHGLYKGLETEREFHLIRRVRLKVGEYY